MKSKINCSCNHPQLHDRLYISRILKHPQNFYKWEKVLSSLSQEVYFIPDDIRLIIWSYYDNRYHRTLFQTLKRFKTRKNKTISFQDQAFIKVLNPTFGDFFLSIQ